MNDSTWVFFNRLKVCGGIIEKVGSLKFSSFGWNCLFVGRTVCVEVNLNGKLERLVVCVSLFPVSWQEGVFVMWFWLLGLKQISVPFLLEIG